MAAEHVTTSLSQIDFQSTIGDSNATILPKTDCSTLEVTSSNQLHPDPLNPDPLNPDPLIPHDREYLCCCGCFQIYCGTITIALFHYFCISLCLIFEISSGANFGFSSLSFNVLGFHVLHYLMIVLLFIGLEQKSSTMLLPYIIYSYVIVGLYIFAWGLLIIVVITAQPSYIRRIIGKHNFSITTIKVILLLKSSLIFLGLALIQTWWNFIVQSCRKYFRQLDNSSDFSSIE